MYSKKEFKKLQNKSNSRENIQLISEEGKFFVQKSWDNIGRGVKAIRKQIDFDDISIIPTFVLTPLTYLGGVFYSINLLGDFWRDVSMFNPILYMVNAFRFGISGITDINIIWSFSMVGLASVVLFLFALHLLEKGSRLRS